MRVRMITWPSCPVTWRISTLRACSRCARGRGLELFTRCRLSHIWSHVLTSGATCPSRVPIACAHRVVPWHLLVLTSSLGAFHWYPRLQPPLSYKHGPCDPLPPVLLDSSLLCHPLATASRTAEAGQPILRSTPATAAARSRATSARRSVRATGLQRFS